MVQSVFYVFYDAVIDAVDEAKQKPLAGRKTYGENSDDDDQPPAVSESLPESDAAEPAQQGKLILDATVAPQAIRFPTDLSLLNEAREFSEQIIDLLFANTTLKKKPRTYRQNARKAYLGIVKKKRPGAKVLRRGIKQQLQYQRRNLRHIVRLLEHFPEGTPLPLPRWLLRRYWVIQHVYVQQWEMYRNSTNRCDDRIVSISQPWVRPIVRGKVDKPTEFGAKLSVSLTGDGVARVDHLRWGAFHEGHDLPSQVEAYRERHGVYPAVVLGDTIYGSRDNRRPILVQILANVHEYRSDAAKILGESEYEPARSQLEKSLMDESIKLVKSSLNALLLLGPEKSIETIRPLLDHSQQEVL